jgi:(2R)-sulfolactate sulfo-lyase subunit beta
VSTKCSERHHDWLACPAVTARQLIPQGIYGVFGETSEITGAEDLAKARAATPEIGEKWYRVWQAYQNDVIEAHKTDDLSDSQPTKGNIAGGLTTIEEKALGNLEKIGRECRYRRVLEPAEAPGKAGTLALDVLGGRGMRRCWRGGLSYIALPGKAAHRRPVVPVISSRNPKKCAPYRNIDLDIRIGARSRSQRRAT